MALKTFTGPGWLIYNNDQYYDDMPLTGYAAYFANALETPIEGDEHDGIFYNMYNKIPTSAVTVDLEFNIIVGFNDQTKSEANARNADMVNWVANGVLSTTNPYDLDFSKSALTTKQIFALMNDFNGSVVYDEEGNETNMTDKVRFYVDGKYYRLIDYDAPSRYQVYNSKTDTVDGVDANKYYLDDNQDAARRPAYTTEVTKTTVTNRYTKGNRNRSQAINYVNKDASSDTLVSFVSRLGELSNNSQHPVATRINKRSFNDAFYKESNVLEFHPIGDFNMWDFGYLTNAESGLKCSSLNNVVACVAGYALENFREDVYDSTTESIIAGKEGDDNFSRKSVQNAPLAFQFIHRAELSEGQSVTLKKIVDVETGETPTFIDKIYFYNPYDGNTLLTEPPEDYDGSFDEMYITADALGTIDGFGTIEKEIDITFEVPETDRYKKAEATIRVKLIQFRAWCR